MSKLNKNIAILFVFIAVFCGSCYHLTGHNKNLAMVSIENIHNDTVEPQLSSMLHSALAEHLSHTRKASSKPLYPLDLKIISLENSNVARAEIRDKLSRDDDSDAYQTVLYRITIKVQYSLSLQEGKSPVSGIVSGIGDLPKMHDRNVPLQHALRLAANDAAKKIIDAISDAPQLQP